MNYMKVGLPAVLWILLVGATTARAQSLENQIKPILDAVEGIHLDSGELEAAFSKALEDPQTLNKWVDKIFSTGQFAPLKDLHLEFKTFSTDSSDHGSLGLAYAYDKDLKRDYLSDDGVNFAGVRLALNAQGNVAFERELNPRDFLQTDLSVHLFRSSGGAVPTIQTDSTAADSIFGYLNDLEDALAEIKSQKELDSSPLWSEFASFVGKHLSTQTYVDFSFAGSFESDQSFDQTQFVYSGQLGLDIKAWRRESTLARWNFLDWPFAALRYLSGVDRSLEPRGSAIPTAVLSLGLVDPQKDDFRKSIGETGIYPRLRVDTAYKSLVLRGMGTSVYFQADFRYYKEIGPPEAVAVAGLDESTYFTAALTSTNGMFASYSTGRLPFDEQDDQVYELGFSLKF